MLSANMIRTVDVASFAGVTKSRLCDWAKLGLLPRSVRTSRSDGELGCDAYLPAWCKHRARELKLMEDRGTKLSKLPKAVAAEGASCLAAMGCAYRALIKDAMDRLEELGLDGFADQLDHADKAYQDALDDWLRRYGGVCGLV